MHLWVRGWRHLQVEQPGTRLGHLDKRDTNKQTSKQRWFLTELNWLTLPFKSIGTVEESRTKEQSKSKFARVTQNDQQWHISEAKFQFGGAKRQTDYLCVQKPCVAEVENDDESVDLALLLCQDYLVLRDLLGWLAWGLDALYALEAWLWLNNKNQMINEN